MSNPLDWHDDHFAAECDGDCKRAMAPSNLLWIRLQLTLTQAEAAQLVAVSENTWARWERGEMKIHPARLRGLERLAEAAFLMSGS